MPAGFPMTPARQPQQQRYQCKTDPEGTHPHPKCDDCTEQFFKCQELPPCATPTSAPAPEPDGCSFRVAKMDAMYDNGYAEGAKAARERVLDAIDEWINSDDHLSLYKWEVREKIRSLRTQQEPQQETTSRSRKE